MSRALVWRWMKCWRGTYGERNREIQRVFSGICVSTKRKFAHRLLKFGFTHLQQAVEEEDILAINTITK